MLKFKKSKQVLPEVWKVGDTFKKNGSYYMLIELPRIEDRFTIKYYYLLSLETGYIYSSSIYTNIESLYACVTSFHGKKVNLVAQEVSE